MQQLVALLLVCACCVLAVDMNGQCGPEDIAAEFTPCVAGQRLGNYWYVRPCVRGVALPNSLQPISCGTFVCLLVCLFSFLFFSSPAGNGSR